MDNSAQFEQIIGKLKTKADLTQVLVSLDEFVSAFFDPKAPDDVKRAFDQLPSELQQVMKETFLNEPITPENQNTIKKRVEALTAALHTIKTVELTIAFQPDEDGITLFSDWVKKNVGPNILIDLRFDKTIVGGALIVAGGTYKDYSVRKNLAGRFQIQREDIMALLQ